MDVCPSTERNNIVFDYVLDKDIDKLIKFKNYNPNKIKIISRKILNKIKQGFW